jgi:sensor histidine kinase YesM
VAAAPGFPYRRLMTDMKYAAILCLLLGMFVTIVEGDGLLSLFEHMVLALCIGLPSFLIIDAVRLALWRPQGWGKNQWFVFVAVVMPASPFSTYAGIVLAYRLLGSPIPAAQTILRDVLLTLFSAFGGMLLFSSKEHTARIEVEAARERARAEEVARQAMQAQLQLLQAQIEPHMLFNTLANLQGLIALDAARATHMLDQLIRYLRATLSSSRADATTLAQEFDLLDAYLGLMAVRMGARLRFSLQLPDALRTASVPPMLLQPLVENAIAHGLEPKIDGGELVVTAAQHGSLLELAVRDTGLGLGYTPARAGTGVGVANTRERLRGLYGEHATLALEPASPQGTVARITLPLEPA